MYVKLISKSIGLNDFKDQTIDNLIVGQARVSSGKTGDDLFNSPEKLLRHCVSNQHWSIFELANLGFEIETSRAIGRELLRHGKMVGLTEFSQRYSEAISYENVELRKQSISNRQSSTDITDPIMYESNGVCEFASDYVRYSVEESVEYYNELLNKNIARETARFILPECTTTKIYMNFRIRELITFLNARLHSTAQKEAQILANLIKDIFIEQCPIIANALYNFENAYNVHILDRIVLEKYKVYKLIDVKYL
jgi:thymidylate synthase (FAD)